ncbi:hypothetical protein [Paraburkholderia azotifigens]|uniref:Cytochrome c oxidase subunit 2A n=1 Tax=Paraburkholderia azotifigens TaxID=2057004 RepID=A0A5C6VQS1_9BURK|nr:hypothetical protein [Paraburkholderia azotifigens]TXC87743.1 hypothetical protein FRZ40_09250 [Paraburkholderia azotifigens]
MDPGNHSGDHDGNASDAEVERIVAQGPHGAIAVAGVAAVVVLAIWIGFYFLVFLPRGVIH